MSDRDAEALALKALDGVGDAALGEWREQHKAFHIRRRLSAAEVLASGLDMIDLRGTPEGRARLLKLIRQNPMLRLFAEQELS